MNLSEWFQASTPFLSQYGLLIVFIGACLEGETILLLAGVFSHRGVLPLEWVIMVGILGAFIGDQTCFYIGRKYGKAVLIRYPGLDKHANKVRPWLKQKSDWVAFGSRFIYGTRTIAPILLAINNYSPKRFAFINFISASLWAWIAVEAGYLIGLEAEKLFGRIVHVEQLVLVLILIFAAWHWYRRKKI